MKYSKLCECCGHSVKAYSHTLNVQLLQALKQLSNFYEANKRGCHLQNDLPKLTKNQYNNFQKLQYFRLIIKKEDGWYPTRLADNFLKGETSIYMPVATFGKSVLTPEHEAWESAEKKPMLRFITEVKGFTWKKLEDYLQD
jgi:hypothetical protein